MLNYQRVSYAKGLESIDRNIQPLLPLVPSLMFFRRVANVSWRWAPDFVPDFVLVGLKPESDLTKYLNVHNVVELDALDDTQQ